MRKITKRTAAIATAAVIGIGALGGAAWANGWLVNGTGTASAAGAKITNMTAVITLDKTVYPGRVVTASAKVTNPNEFPVSLTAVTGAGAPTATRGGGDNAACRGKLTALGVNAILPVLPTTPITVGPTGDKTVNISMTISPDFPIECQDTLIGATFTFAGTSTV